MFFDVGMTAYSYKRAGLFDIHAIKMLNESKIIKFMGHFTLDLFLNLISNHLLFTTTEEVINLT